MDVVILGGSIFAVVVFAIIAWNILTLRTVVGTNEVHIVQRGKKTVSYGKDHDAGNVYYAWPEWIPFLGLQVKSLPVSNFNLNLEKYAAYDKDRLPFELDIVGFFRIEDSNRAAQRVASFEELRAQLSAILQGAARTILASRDIEAIMQGRAEFGTAFTKEVTEQLNNWGIVPVKNIELLDIRDASNSKVIANIMEKRKSHIEMESRVEVAKNHKLAENAEIDAEREIEMNRQTAAQQVGIRTAEKEREVGVATQQSVQIVKDQEKVTAEKTMEVVKVQQVKQAEIAKEVGIVQAEQNKQTEVIVAEGEKQKVVLTAEAALAAKLKEAEGIEAEGKARAVAEEKMQLAPVNAQLTLAKEIGDNQPYQQYLITIRNVEKDEKIGIEQAKALEKADIKVIANAGNASQGLTSVGEVVSSKGGTEIGAMLEGLAQTDMGQAFLNKFLGGDKPTK